MEINIIFLRNFYLPNGKNLSKSQTAILVIPFWKFSERPFATKTSRTGELLVERDKVGSLLEKENVWTHMTWASQPGLMKELENGPLRGALWIVEDANALLFKFYYYEFSLFATITFSYWMRRYRRKKKNTWQRMAHVCVCMCMCEKEWHW